MDQDAYNDKYHITIAVLCNEVTPLYFWPGPLPEVLVFTGYCPPGVC
jgi:hypothetical protein